MKPLIAALLAAIALYFGYQQLDGQEDQRALFIGNSLTFGNDLPSMVANVMGENGIGLEVEMIATSGRTLSQHAIDPAVRERRLRLRGPPGAVRVSGCCTAPLERLVASR